MSHCKETTGRVGPFVDGELSPSESAIVSEHIARCAPCREIEREFRALAALLTPARAAATENEEKLWQAFDQDLTARLRSRPASAGLWLPAPLAAGLAIVIAATMLTSVLNYRELQAMRFERMQMQATISELKESRMNRLGLMAPATQRRPPEQDQARRDGAVVPIRFVDGVVVEGEVY